MNIVNTTAPIAIDELKKYFTDKTTFYIINYKESALRNGKLLTYLSNLDLPIDIHLSDSSEEDQYSLLKDYLNSSMLVNIRSLEYFAMSVIAEVKELSNSDKHKNFIQENKEIIDSWISKLDSLTLYNMYIVNSDEFKEFVESFPEDDTDSLIGVNFISLLKHEDFYFLYNKVDKLKLKFYKKYFNDYMFKGKNLFSFWANENNPMFLLTHAIGNGLDTEEYIQAKKNTIQGSQNVSPI